jgi:hypothetical protein
MKESKALTHIRQNRASVPWPTHSHCGPARPSIEIDKQGVLDHQVTERQPWKFWAKVVAVLVVLGIDFLQEQAKTTYQDHESLFDSLLPEHLVSNGCATTNFKSHTFNSLF